NCAGARSSRPIRASWRSIRSRRFLLAGRILAPLCHSDVTIPRWNTRHCHNGAMRRTPSVQKYILIVEDEPAIRDMVAFALRKAEMEPAHASDARTAQDLIAER